MGWDTKLIRGALCIALPATSIRVADATAQQAGAVQVQVDNDGFNFWLRPAQRPDGEYTNGVRITTELARAPLWRRLMPGSPPCAEAASVPRCSTAQFVVGQEMYTPAEDSQPYTYAGWRTQRPYAGWLYGSAIVRSVGGSTSRSLGVTLGVTGPPSLAEQAQRSAHRIMWRYTSQPVGWDTQIRFEPGIIVTARQQWMPFSASMGGVRLLDAVVDVGGSVGNVITNAEGGAELRAVVNLSHPWRRARRRGPVELVAKIGVRGELVARNMFLDGNIVNPDRRVDSSPAVRTLHGAMGLRLGAVVISYAVTERSREYATGPGSHTFSSVTMGIGGIPAAGR